MAALPGDPIDIIPGPCESNAITQCIAARACELETLSPPSIAGSTGLLSIKLGTIGSLTVEINAADVCLLTALRVAFEIAGVPFPTEPPPIPVPDFSDCVAALDEQAAEAASELGALSDTFDVEFDENGNPIRIQA